MAGDKFRKYRHKFVLEHSGDRSVGIQPYYNEAEVSIQFRFPEINDSGCTETLKKQLTDALQETLNEVLAQF